MLRIGSKIKNSVFRLKTRSFFSLYDQKGKASLVRTERKSTIQDKRRLIKKSIGRLNFFGFRRSFDDGDDKGQSNKNNNKKQNNTYKRYLDLKESNINYEQHSLACEKALNTSTEDNFKYLKNKTTAGSVIMSLKEKYEGDKQKAVIDLLKMFERDIEKVLVNSKVFGYEELPQLKIKLVSTHNRINESLEQYFNGAIPEEIKEMTNEVYLACLADNVNEFLPKISDLLDADLIEVFVEDKVPNLQTLLKMQKNGLDWESLLKIYYSVIYVVSNLEKTKCFELIERQDAILQYFKFLENVIKEVFETEASKGYLNPFIVNLACEFQMKEQDEFINRNKFNINPLELVFDVKTTTKHLLSTMDIEIAVKKIMSDYRHNQSNLEQNINDKINKLKTKGDKTKDDVWEDIIGSISKDYIKKADKVKDSPLKDTINNKSENKAKKKKASNVKDNKESKVKGDVWEDIIDSISKDNAKKEEHKNKTKKFEELDKEIDKYIGKFLDEFDPMNPKKEKQDKDTKKEQKQDIKGEKKQDIKFEDIKKDLDSFLSDFPNLDQNKKQEKKIEKEEETNNNSADKIKKEKETVKDEKPNKKPMYSNENKLRDPNSTNPIIQFKLLFYKIDYYEKSIKNLNLLIMRNSLQIQIVQNKLDKKYIKFPKRRLLQNRLKTLKLKDQQYHKALQKVEEKYHYIIYFIRPSWMIKEAFGKGEDYVRILEEEYDNLGKEEKIEEGKEEEKSEKVEEEEEEKETDKDKTKNTEKKPNSFEIPAFLKIAITFYIFYKLFIQKKENEPAANIVNSSSIQEEEFVHMLKNQLIKEINLYGSFRQYYVICMDNNGNTYNYRPEDPVVFLKQLEDIQRENGIKPENFVPVNVRKETNYHNNIDFNASKYIFNIILMLVFYKVFKNMGKNIKKMSGNIQKKEFKKDLNVRFKDIAGMDEVKEEMFEFVEFLKNPAKFQKLGAKMPKGALLSGPPGTGKTHIAKAIAGEAGIPFLYVSGSEFVEMFVGVGSSRVRDLFAEAKKKSPAIIFIDEIDAIAKKRDSAMNNDEVESTLNQLLVEMDGFDTNTNVVIIGSTNLKDTIDPALLRPGRFDRIIEVNLPSLGEREEIFRIYLEKVKLSEDRSVDYYAKRLATLTPGFSPADIANIVNEAAILAVRSNNDAINEIHFERATEKVIAGIEVQSASFEEQKEVISVHECGHAVVSWFLPGGSPLLKLVIKPRSKGALGFAQYLPAETAIYSKEELLDQITGILGGRCAELVFFNKVSTGAYDDLQKAKQIALELVTVYGMSDGLKNIRFEYDDYGNKRFSEKTHKLIDEEISKIINEQTEKCIQLIKEKKDLVQKLSNKLLEKEILIFTDIVEILGERPYEPHEGFKRFIDEVDKLRLKYEPTQE